MRDSAMVWVAAGSVVFALLACKAKPRSETQRDGSAPETTASAVATSKSAESAPSTPPITSKQVSISSEKLLREFRTDPVAAKRRYRGRWLRVSAELLELVSGMFAADVIDIGPHGSDVLEDDLVACRFPEDVEKPLDGLKVGKPIVVLGKLEGHHLDRVRLEECRVLSGGR